jgi:gliding motility-associated lipoprotein GldH
MRFLVLSLCLAGSALISGCGPDYLYRKNFELPPSGWTYADTLDFPITIEDTTRLYNLDLELRHTREYPFENLYVQIHTNFPGGKRLSRRLSLELADDAGLWQGDCGRHSCKITIPLQQGAFFNVPGEYLFTLEQFMRRDSLPGLESIEFKVEDTGKSR